MRFALSPGDVRIQVLVAMLDDADAPFAETWRRVGKAAEELGFTRPGYHLVRVLARAERLRRRAKTEMRKAVVGVLEAFASPPAMDVQNAAEKFGDAWAKERFVLEQHKPSSARPPPPAAEQRHGGMVRNSQPMGERDERASGRSLPVEAIAVWCLYALQAAAVLVTYARLPPEVLYNVGEAGDLAAGLGHALVLLNYPLALGAIALAAVAGGPRPLVWAAIVLCAVTAAPGVVDQDDLDARWINVVPAAGLGLALGLTVVAWRRDGLALIRHARGDALRLALLAALLVLALPWTAANLGFYFPGDIFMGEEVPQTRDPGLAAVHLGFHHGLAGVVLALTALALSRPPVSRLLAAYLSLMLAYGLANAIQDGWNEQLWKRGTVDTHLASVLRPELSLGWLAIVVAAGLVYALWFRPDRRT